MRLLAAPDKFRGTLSARAAAAAIAAGAARAGWRALAFPLADGGEGTLDVLGGGNRRTTVTGPLGAPLVAAWRLDEDGTALIEAALVCGLRLAGGAQGNDPLAATSRGVGELVAAALAAGAERLLVCVGGVAATDGGAGALAPLLPLRAPLEVACDVEARFLDAAELFAPQKGATPEEVRRLRERLECLAERYRAELGVDVRALPGAGAAGGLAGGLAAVGGRLVSGFELVASRLGLDERLAEADLAVSGEGRLDATSLRGKVVGGLLAHAAVCGAETLVVAGEVAAGTDVPAVSLVERCGRRRALAERAAGTAPKLASGHAGGPESRTPSPLPAGSRRPAGARRCRGLPLPLADRLAAGRLPGRRPVLRPQRLPDHVPAARRVAGQPPDRPAPLLAAPRAPLAARGGRGGARRPRPGRALRPRRPGSDARRRAQLPLLLHELAPDPRQPLVLRADGQPVAAAAPLVAGGGGAVLRDLAAAARPRPRAARAAPPAARRRLRDRRLGGRDVAPLPAGRPVARLLRHRHACLPAASGDPARARLAGARADAAVAAAARAARRLRPRRHGAPFPADARLRPHAVPGRRPGGGGLLRCPDRGRRAPSQRSRPGAGDRTVALAGRTQLRRLPLALAGDRALAAGGGRALDGAGRRPPAGGDRAGGRRALLPLRRAADPQRPAAAETRRLAGPAAAGARRRRGDGAGRRLRPPLRDAVGAEPGRRVREPEPGYGRGAAAAPRRAAPARLPRALGRHGQARAASLAEPARGADPGARRLRDARLRSGATGRAPASCPRGRQRRPADRRHDRRARHAAVAACPARDRGAPGGEQRPALVRGPRQTAARPAGRPRGRRRQRSQRHELGERIEPRSRRLGARLAGGTARRLVRPLDRCDALGRDAPLAARLRGLRTSHRRRASRLQLTSTHEPGGKHGRLERRRISSCARPGGRAAPSRPGPACVPRSRRGSRRAPGKPPRDAPGSGSSRRASPGRTPAACSGTARPAAAPRRLPCTGGTPRRAR